MDKLETFQEFLTTTNTISFNYFDFAINMLIAMLIANLIKYTYIKCGNSVSNRKNLARNLPLLTITTVFIITIVKSSLALSLGLVGALSIVRFRTAVKEPIELLYLFLCIAVGLGLGADQRVISIISSIIVLGYIWITFMTENEDQPFNENMVVSVESHGIEKFELLDIIAVLKKSCAFVSLIRIDESQERIEAHFDVEFISLEHVSKLRKSSLAFDENVQITIMDNNGLI